MLPQVLYAHWKVARWALLVFVPLALAMPLLAVRVAQGLAGDPADAFAGISLRSGLELWVPVFPLLAAALGATFGLTAWSWDHNANHVYALTLPVPRWYYALLKFGAGILVLLLPVTALAAGSLAAVLPLELPAGLRAYPVAFTIRFLFAALIAYGVTFALTAGTIRTAVYIMAATVLVVLFGSIAVEYLKSVGMENLWSPLDLLYRALLVWPGPFHVFGGNWMLIDV